jgi:hypothetical protein
MPIMYVVRVSEADEHHPNQEIETMNANEINTATREQLADELAAACEYTEDWQTATMDDLRERVRRI